MKKLNMLLRDKHLEFLATFASLSCFIHHNITAIRVCPLYWEGANTFQ